MIVMILIDIMIEGHGLSWLTKICPCLIKLASNDIYTSPEKVIYI